MELYPFLFEPNHHAKIWGGEDWLVSGHHSSPSIIANGPLKGLTLEEIVAEHGRALMGADAPQPDSFPLLFKVIDAHDRLSVQVHPNEKAAALVGGEAKTEMWYALGHSAPIYAGFRPGVTKADVERAIGEGTVEEVLSAIDLKKDSTLFIPGGMVHAVCAGALIYEVQQSSDTTYRMYDWGRMGPDGNPRELHVEKSLASIDCSLGTPIPGATVECDYFRFMPWRISGLCDVNGDERSFRVLHVAEGTVRIAWCGGEVEVGCGRSVLIPANLPLRIRTEVPSLLLSTEL